MHALNILFLLPKSRRNQHGDVSLLCRLTSNKRRVQFNTGIVIPLTWWNQEKQKITKKNTEAEQLQTKIHDITRKIKSAEQQLVIIGDSYGVREIYNIVILDNRETITLLSLYDQKLEQMKKLLQKDYTQSTYDKFCYVRQNMVDFIRLTYKQSDIRLDKIDLQFLHRFETFLKVDQQMKQVSANKVIQRFRSVIKMAVDYGWLPLNPFIGYKPRKVETEILYLTNSELELLTQFHFNQPRLNLVRDIFIFSTYTGLHYHEAFNLTKENLIQESDGSIWVVYMRLKTQKWSRVPLLLQAQNILASFEQVPKPYLLPRISNQKVNSYLKEIADIVGIKKNLTHKAARKTFASTVLLSNGVPMEIVSKLLGHSSIRITETHYAELSNTKITHEVTKLQLLLNKEQI